MVMKIKDTDTLQAALRELCVFLAKENVPEHSVFDSRLVACELLGNVLRHANGEARLQGAVLDGFVELKIISDHVIAPTAEVKNADLFAEHGRGLFLVKTLCEERIYVEEDGVRVQIKINAEM